MSADDVSAGGLNAAGEIKIQGVVCGQLGSVRDSMKLTGKRIQEQYFGFVLCRTVLYRCWPQRYHFCSDSHQIPNNMERVVVSPISYVDNSMAPRMKRVSGNHMKTMGVLLSNLNNCLLTNIPLQSNVLQETSRIFWWFVSILCRNYIDTMVFLLDHPTSPQRTCIQLTLLQPGYTCSLRNWSSLHPITHDILTIFFFWFDWK